MKCEDDSEKNTKKKYLNTDLITEYTKLILRLLSSGMLTVFILIDKC